MIFNFTFCTDAMHRPGTDAMHCPGTDVMHRVST